MPPETWSLIVDEPRRGAWNMAVDEALMEAVAEGRRGPTVRFYRWSPACLSLGVFQRLEDALALPPDQRPPDLVRRITGGGAIWHDAEWTYSLVLPRAHPLSGRDAAPLYRTVHRGLIAGLRSLGVDCGLRGELRTSDVGLRTSDSPPPDERALFCFTRGDANDIITNDGRKLVGSAQRRLPEAVLQHGSVVLETPPGSTLAASVRERTGRDVGYAETLEALRPALAASLGVGWREDRPTDGELARAEGLVASKHAHPDWLNRK
jgi:lipoate-protein ligase A